MGLLWSYWRESDSRPPPYQGGALPLSHSSIYYLVVIPVAAPKALPHCEHSSCGLWLPTVHWTVGFTRRPYCATVAYIIIFKGQSFFLPLFLLYDVATALFAQTQVFAMKVDEQSFLRKYARVKPVAINILHLFAKV